MRLRRDRNGGAFLARAPSASVVVAMRDRSATTATESLSAPRYGVALTAQDGCT
jgi:hypothetical protein